MTIEEQLRQRGIQQECLDKLRRVLELRFGSLDSELAARLEAAQSEDLQHLFDRAVTAASMEEFLEEPHPR